MSEGWDLGEVEYLWKERRRWAPLYRELGGKLGLAVKGNVFNFFWLDTIKENTIGYGQDSQNPVTSGAITSDKINSWTARHTDNRQKPQMPQGGGVLSPSFKHGQHHALAHQITLQLFLKINYANPVYHSFKSALLIQPPISISRSS